MELVDHLSIAGVALVREVPSNLGVGRETWETSTPPTELTPTPGRGYMPTITHDLKFFLLLSVVATALLAAEGALNDLRSEMQFGELSGETAFVPASQCGLPNSGTNPLGSTAIQPFFNIGRQSPFINIYSSEVEVIPNGYRVTLWAESLPNQVQVSPDFTGDSSVFDLYYGVQIFHGHNCKSNGSSHFELAIGHRAWPMSYPGAPVTKTLEEALSHSVRIRFADNDGSYRTIASTTRTLTVDRTANKIVFHVTAPTITVLPTPSEAADYSVYVLADYRLPYLQGNSKMCNIDSNQSPKSCTFPDPFVVFPVSVSLTSSTANDAGEGLFGMCS
jgi:hypothetical protein